MGIKDFFLKQALKYKMKGVPEAQQNMMLGAMDKHPEFFKRVGEEVKALQKQGMSELAATMQVMRKHQSELQKIMIESK